MCKCRYWPAWEGMLLSKKIKAIVADCSIDDIWDKVLARLEIEGALELSYCVIASKPKFEKQLETFKASHPDTIFHDAIEATMGLPALKLKVPVIDEPKLRALAEHEAIVMRMLDRMDPTDCFTYRDRYRHYIRLLSYWSAVLEEIKPDLVLFGLTPHMGWDYVLYILARHSGIRTVMFSLNSALGRVMWSETIGSYSDRVAHSYLSPPTLSSREINSIDNHLQLTRQEYTHAKPRYAAMLETLNQGEKVNWTLKTPLRPLKSAVWVLIFAGRKLRRVLDRVFPPASLYVKNYWKHPNMTFESSHYSARERMGVEKYKLGRLAQLNKCYETLSIKLSENDLNTPFIFLALHYQPEATTSPEGGYYVDQRLIVDALSRSLPKGWRLYVKEHYLQLKAKSSKGWQSRDLQFYKDIVEHSNVRLVSLETSSFTLIDSSKAMATITGYAAWEALVRGKPAILFGRPWFGACPGAYMVKSVEEIHSAILKISDPSNCPDSAAVRDYIIAYYAVSFAGFRSKWNKEASGLTNEQNIEAFCKAIRGYLAYRFNA